MMSEIKTMSVKEFRKYGFLQEVNRCFFHPLGIALETICGENGEELGRIWDYRDDPEGMFFGDDPDPEKAERVARLYRSKLKARMDRMGYVVQPVPGGHGVLPEIALNEDD